jgi:hypothetical protein
MVFRNPPETKRFSLFGLSCRRVEVSEEEKRTLTIKRKTVNKHIRTSAFRASTRLICLTGVACVALRRLSLARSPLGDTAGGKF